MRTGSARYTAQRTRTYRRRSGADLTADFELAADLDATAAAPTAALASEADLDAPAIEGVLAADQAELAADVGDHLDAEDRWVLGECPRWLR